MSPELICIVCVGIMLLLLGFGMPIGFAMGIAGFIGYAWLDSISRALSMFSMVPWQTFANYSLTVVPMFILMGMLAGAAGFGEDIFHAVQRWAGKIPGSLAISTCWGCAAFGTLSGDAISAAITIGKIAIPEMEKARYDRGLALACVASAGPLAAMIPPSVLLCIYGMITEQSIGKLLMAGFLPGILTAFVFSVTIYIRARWNPLLAPARATASSRREKLESLRNTWVVVLCAVTVMGGMYTGIFSPTEAGGMGALIVMGGGFLKRSLGRSQLLGSIKSTLKVMGMFSVVVLGSFMFAYMVTISNTIPKLVDLIVGLHLSTTLLIICIMALYLVLGCFMQAIAMMFLTLPFLLPILNAYHIDLIWMGILVVHMCEVGCITPPFGITVLAIRSIRPDIPTTEAFKGILSFLLADFAALAFLIAFPQIALWLPSRMGF